MNDFYEGARLGALIAIGLAAWSIADDIAGINIKLTEIAEALEIESR